MMDEMPIITRRWAQAHTASSMQGWRALADMLSTLHIKFFLAGDHEIASDMLLLSDIAHRHYLDMLPTQISLVEAA